jgi:hypothetical protein
MTTTDTASLLADLDRVIDMIQKVTSIIEADVSNPKFPLTTQDAIASTHRYLADTAMRLAMSLEHKF